MAQLKQMVGGRVGWLEARIAVLKDREAEELRRDVLFGVASCLHLDVLSATAQLAVWSAGDRVDRLAEKVAS